ncbi:MAG: hypothetical protein HY296_00730 [Thaumarchaeota archaeon]|nr:hypothetical protein [Nitrososphaerota archaeon]
MRVADLLKENLSYAFIAVGIVWLVVAFVVSALLLWPVLACILSGLLLRIRPGMRLTWALVKSSAVLGFLLCAYQVYASFPWLGGAFATVAEVSLGLFAVFAVVHLALLWSGSPKPKPV